MEDELVGSAWIEPADSTSDGQWQDTIQLLRLVQSDFRGVRKQLEQVNNNLSERERLVSQRLQYALQISGGFQILRLLPYTAGSLVARIGKTTLGEVARPKVLEKSNRLEINCLGKFEIRSSQSRVERWRSIKAKSVFQYLLTRRRQPVVKEVLMEMLWPECDPRSASNNLKAAIHGLRQTLGRIFESKKGFDYVLFSQGCYLINPEIDLWLDVDEFERHWALGQSLEKDQKIWEAMRQYEMAETLYGGDYLEDEPYEEWTLLRREALKDMYLLILGKLADYSMNNSDYASCITYSQKILVKDSCREDAYRRLMCCYNRLGQRNRALHWYEICRRIIKTELDATPDPETNAIHQRLLKNETI